jgi:hypothetical protein
MPVIASTEPIEPRAVGVELPESIRRVAQAWTVVSGAPAASAALLWVD